MNRIEICLLAAMAAGACTSANTETSCNPTNHCHMEEGQAVCDSGYGWADPQATNDFRCVGAGPGPSSCDPASGAGCTTSCPGCSSGSGCTSNSQCASGSVCAANGQCVASPAAICAGTLTLCSGQCVDTATATANCGGCGLHCAAGQVCNHGQCAVLPTDCVTAGGCALDYYCEPTTHLCAAGCLEDSDCPRGSSCDATTHTCRCGSGTHSCGQACVLDDASESCGTSCTACPAVANATPTCLAGTCDFTCRPGFHRCGERCLSDTSPQSCGSSCTACPGTTGGTPACIAGQCSYTCAAGYHLCDFGYPDCYANDDPSACGSSCTPCGVVNNGTSDCSGGSCTAVCDPGYRDCNGECLSNTSIETSCGTSCNPCPAVVNGSSTCDSGACTAQCNPGAWQSGQTTCQAWNVATVATISGYSTGFDGALALDSSGNAHICYFDEDTENLMYSHWTGSDWATETVDSSGKVAAFCSIALDAAGHPRIAYLYDTDNLKYAYWDGTVWTIETIDDSGNVGTYSSLTLDSAGNPHVTYADTAANSLQYAHRNAGTWVSDTIAVGDPSGQWFGLRNSLALDSQDLPHVTYDGDTTAPSVEYAWYDGSAWHTETIATPASSSASVQSGSLVLDSSDQPHVTYQSDTPSSVPNQIDATLYYAVRRGGAWTVQMVDDRPTDPSTVTFSSLTVGSDGTVGVTWSFRPWNYTTVMKYAEYDGTSWTISTLSSSTFDTRGVAIAIDGNNDPHVIYEDASTSSIVVATK